MNGADLDRIGIASPCDANWNEMDGDARVRLCGQCATHVYDASAMTRAELSALIEATGGRVCARLYRRADGTLLTADCPRAFERLKARAAWIGGSLATLAAGVMGVALFVARGRAADIKKVHAVETLCNWAAGQPPPHPSGVKMGKIAIPHHQPVGTPAPLIRIRTP